MVNIGLGRVHKVLGYFYFGLGLSFGAVVLISARNHSRMPVPFEYLLCLGLLLISALHFYAYRGALEGRGWARYISRAIGILFLFGFPLGTILGVYMLSQSGSKWRGP